MVHWRRHKERICCVQRW